MIKIPRESLTQMDYYKDLACDEPVEMIKIADDILLGRIYLPRNNAVFTQVTDNIFDHIFTNDLASSFTYLFSMDWMSNLISAYKETKNPVYYDKFNEYLEDFTVYSKRTDDKNSYYFSDHPIYFRTVTLIKALMIFPKDWSLYDEAVDLLGRQAEWCLADNNHADNNHGLMTDYALLHMGVLFSNKEFIELALRQVEKLYDNSFYNDGFNVEGSMYYHFYNVRFYREIIDFCVHYGIAEASILHTKASKSADLLPLLRYQNGAFPVFGNGNGCNIKNISNDDTYNKASFYPDANIAVLKNNDIYFLLRCNKHHRTLHQHNDALGVTLQYLGHDIILDSGFYNYDIYHPVTRFCCGTAGHSSVFPTFLDRLTVKEYLKRITFAKITEFDESGTMKASYEIDGGLVSVSRFIKIENHQIEIKDSWQNKSEFDMRQRFILPKQCLEECKLHAVNKTFSTQYDGINIAFQFLSDSTRFNFDVKPGFISYKYNEFDQSICLDSTANHSKSGEIKAIIKLYKKEEGNIYE